MSDMPRPICMNDLVEQKHRIFEDKRRILNERSVCNFRESNRVFSFSRCEIDIKSSDSQTIAVEKHVWESVGALESTLRTYHNDSKKRVMATTVVLDIVFEPLIRPLICNVSSNTKGFFSNQDPESTCDRLNLYEMISPPYTFQKGQSRSGNTCQSLLLAVKKLRAGIESYRKPSGKQSSTFTHRNGQTVNTFQFRHLESENRQEGLSIKRIYYLKVWVDENTVNQKELDDPGHDLKKLSQNQFADRLLIEILSSYSKQVNPVQPTINKRSRLSGCKRVGCSWYSPEDIFENCFFILRIFLRTTLPCGHLNATGYPFEQVALYGQVSNGQRPSDPYGHESVCMPSGNILNWLSTDERSAFNDPANFERFLINGFSNASIARVDLFGADDPVDPGWHELVLFKTDMSCKTENFSALNEKRKTFSALWSPDHRNIPPWAKTKFHCEDDSRRSFVQEAVVEMCDDKSASSHLARKSSEVDLKNLTKEDVRKRDLQNPATLPKERLRKDLFFEASEKQMHSDDGDVVITYIKEGPSLLQNTAIPTQAFVREDNEPPIITPLSPEADIQHEIYYTNDYFEASVGVHNYPSVITQHSPEADNQHELYGTDDYFQSQQDETISEICVICGCNITGDHACAWLRRQEEVCVDVSTHRHGNRIFMDYEADDND